MNLNLGDTQLLIAKAKEYNLLRNELAYVLATAYHETAGTMKPVREYGGETYLKSKKYYPYVGMGYVQLTWKANYEKASKELGVDFVKDPKLLLNAKYAAPILIVGMKEGWFTGKKLADYITLSKSDFVGARKIINGTDKKDLIATYAKSYDTDLIQAKYGLEPTEMPVQSDPVVPSTPQPSEPKPSVEPSVSFINAIVELLMNLFRRK